jgi:hypothetical protein
MATEKKHIAVYLDPAVEQALIAFCEQKGLMSKKGTMFSAGVNAALAEFFRVVDTEGSNIPQVVSNTPSSNISSNIPEKIGNIPSNIPIEISDIPPESLAVEVLPGKLKA